MQTIDLELYQKTGQRKLITGRELSERNAKIAAERDRENCLLPNTSRHGAKPESEWGNFYLEHYTWMLLEDN